MLEMRAVYTSIRWVLSRPAMFAKSVLLFTDSAVTYFALSKGRSSSYQLLRVVRRIAACMLGGGLSFTLSWVPTALNPADYASRHSL